MLAGVMVFAFCAVAVIFWSVSRAPRLSYVRITSDQLKEKRLYDENLIVIEITAATEAAFPCLSSSDALCLRRTELHDILRWIPPRATIVLRSNDEIRRLHASIEQLLLVSGINIVFWHVVTASVANNAGEMLPELADLKTAPINERDPHNYSIENDKLPLRGPK